MYEPEMDEYSPYASLGFYFGTPRRENIMKGLKFDSC
jgi:hypothetical protein